MNYYNQQKTVKDYFLLSWLSRRLYEYYSLLFSLTLTFKRIRYSHLDMWSTESLSDLEGYLPVLSTSLAAQTERQVKACIYTSQHWGELQRRGHPKEKKYVWEDMPFYCGAVIFFLRKVVVDILHMNTNYICTNCLPLICLFFSFWEVVSKSISVGWWKIQILVSISWFHSH